MKLNNKYILRDIAGEKVVVKQGTHGVDMTKIISFNGSAAALWENFCGKEFASEDVTSFLVEKYGITAERATADAQLWIEKLKDCGVIAI